MEAKRTNTQFADLLRAIAEVYDRNPDIPQLYGLEGRSTEHVFCMSREEFARTVKAFGPGRKDADNDGLLFFPELAAGSGLRIFGFKDRCCERIQVGTKVIPAREETVLPAAPEQVIPVYEWHCAPFLETPEPAEVTA